MTTTQKYTRRPPYKGELLKKSREAALSAIQTFNNPNIDFKSETYIVLMTIAWTYLLHAYYKKNQVDYRYKTSKGGKTIISKTYKGATKYWELEQCLTTKESPIDKMAVKNLCFLIGIRHEIEHQMTTRLDHILSPNFQACCLNYHEEIVKLFGEKQGIAKHLCFSLQLSSIEREQVDILKNKELPKNIQQYIIGFNNSLTPEQVLDPKFAYYVMFTPKLAKKLNKADETIGFIAPNDPLAKTVDKKYAAISEVELQKWKPKKIVEQMHKEGFVKFSMHNHTQLYKNKNAKDIAKRFGTWVSEGQWYWYDSWLKEVREHCQTVGYK